MIILTLNCRMYSMEYRLFDWGRRVPLATGKVERIVVGDSFITHTIPGRPPQHLDQDCHDHTEALELVLTTLTDPKVGVTSEINSIKGVGHRVAHGGEKFTRSVIIDEKVITAIREMAVLAPLHNNPNVAGIAAAQKLLPGVRQVAVFDTAFHQTMPEAAYIYPLPFGWYTEHGIRRYGFHGPSHLYACRRGAALAGVSPESANMVTVHTGDGVSLCAIRDGVSIDTSMGLTPLEGVMMNNRCGNIDPGIISFLIEKAGMSPKSLELFLNEKSGVTGIVGRRTSHRTLVEEALNGDERCRLALDMEAYRLKKCLGAYLAVIGQADAVVFTYADGRRYWPIRGMALRDMEQFGITLDPARDVEALKNEREVLISSDDSPVKVFVVPSGEDVVMVEDVASTLG